MHEKKLLFHENHLITMIETSDMKEIKKKNYGD